MDGGAGRPRYLRLFVGMDGLNQQPLSHLREVDGSFFPPLRSRIAHHRSLSLTVQVDVSDAAFDDERNRLTRVLGERMKKQTKHVFKMNTDQHR